jgi:hypothetical protein
VAENENGSGIATRPLKANGFLLLPSAACRCRRLHPDLQRERERERERGRAVLTRTHTYM